MKKTLAAAVLSISVLGGLALAAPKVNTSAHKHPNLNEAQQLIASAYQKIQAAQTANEYDMGGHAAKAKEALETADREIKLAAEAANK